MVANSGMKHKSETMLEMITGLVRDFVLYFVTVFFTLLHVKYPLHVTLAQGTPTKC